jgi:septal ring factor EnvC (AmiA/AmiB activator)
VYGRQVVDFRQVDYDRLTVLGLSAIQALSKENEKLASEGAALSAQMKDQDARLQQQAEEIAALQAALASVHQSLAGLSSGLERPDQAPPLRRGTPVSTLESRPARHARSALSVHP